MVNADEMGYEQNLPWSGGWGCGGGSLAGDRICDSPQVVFLSSEMMEQDLSFHPLLLLSYRWFAEVSLPLSYSTLTFQVERGASRLFAKFPRKLLPECCQNRLSY
jgi:hypothetical protein